MAAKFYLLCNLTAIMGRIMKTCLTHPQIMLGLCGQAMFLAACTALAPQKTRVYPKEDAKQVRMDARRSGM